MTTTDLSMYDHYSDNVLFERRDHGVLIVTINRPDRMNSLTLPMFDELADVWGDIGRDRLTNVVVLTGAGRGFCAGMDVREPDPTPEQTLSLMESERKRLNNLLALDKPVISAINGAAVGYGLSAALLADISVAAEDAILSDGHTKVGVVAGDHAALIWPLLVGMAKTKYYILTSRRLDGKEAERIGLVSLSVPTDQVLPVALDIADELARGSQQAIRWTKRSLNAGWITNAIPQHELSTALEMLNFFSPDYAEARQAFREGREPDFPSSRASRAAAKTGA
jgi:enoyl-CoA hydratase